MEFNTSSEESFENSSDFNLNKSKNESMLSNESHCELMHSQNIQYHNQVKRESSHRIFVNRSFQLSNIKFYGFDMDHTLAGLFR